MHFLDLPLLNKEPSYNELHECCVSLQNETQIDFATSQKLDKGTRQWLSRLATHELSWLNEDDAEKIREMAARRLSQECGVTATSEQRRHLVLSDQLTVVLNEPGVTEDMLGKLTWGSSLILAKRLVRSPSLVAGMRVIELGAGTGLCGITAKLVGARQVDVTDLPEIVPNLTHNVDMNNVNCQSYVLDWKNPELREAGATFDVCLVSDPVYSREHPPWLLNAIKTVAAPIVLLQLPLRKGFEGEREHIWSGLPKLGYVQVETEEEEGRDLFGDQKYSYTKWQRLN